MDQTAPDPRVRVTFGKSGQMISYVIFPIVLIAFLILTLSSSKPSAIIFGAGVLGLLGIEVLRKWLGRNRTQNDTYTDAATSLSASVLTGLVNNLFLVPLVFLWMQFLTRITPLSLEPVLKHNLGTWGMIITAVLIVLAVDFIYYWGHRGGHRIEILWGSHSVHHSSEHFNPSTATRISFLDELWDIFLLSSLTLLGVNPLYIIGAYAVVLLYQLPRHQTWVKTLPRPIEFLLNTPEHHRAHHAYQRIYLDKNFGGILIIWDRIFGTYADMDPEMEPKFGLTSPIGTFNPIKVLFGELAKMTGKVVKAGSPSVALSYMFKPPGWKPQDI